MTTDDRRPLPDDVARCLDYSCPLRESCRRWLDQDSFRRGEGVFMLETPRQEGWCRYQIPLMETKHDDAAHG